MRRQIFIIFSALILSGCILLILANIQGNWVHRNLEKIILQSCEKTLDCRLTARLAGVGFLNNQLVLTDLSAMPPENNNSWSWSCKRLTLSFSLWQLLSKRLFAFSLDCHDFSVQTVYDNGDLGITPHIKELAREPDLPIDIALTACSVKPLCITVTDKKGNSGTATASISLAQNKTHFKIRSHVFDCKLCTSEHTLLWNVSGELEAFCNKKSSERILASHITLSCKPTVDVTEHITITFNCKDDSANLTINNHDKSLTIQECNFKFKPGGLSCIAAGHAQKVERFFPQIGNKNCSTDIKIEAEVHYENQLKAQIHAALNDIILLDTQVPYTGQLEATLTEQQTLATFDLMLENEPICRVTASADIAQNNYQASARLLKPCPIFDVCRLTEYRAQVHINQENVNAHMQGGVTFSDSQSVPFSFVVSPENNNHYLTGYWADALFSGIVTTSSGNKKMSFDLSSHDGLKLGSCVTYTDKNGIACNAHLHSAGIQFILNRFKLDAQAHGDIGIEAYLNNNSLDFHTTFHGMARLGTLHNWLKNISIVGSYDLSKKTCNIAELKGELYRGVFRITDAKCILDQHNALEYLHIPITLTECLINVRKDLFTMVSSGLVISYKKGELPHISGTVFFDRTMIKENLFSPQFIQSLIPGPISAHQPIHFNPTLAIALQTKDVIQVKTPLIELTAHMRLFLEGSASNPELQGRLFLQSGFLAFPYARLLLSKGRVEFVKGRPADPIIELHAHNTIKKHKVSLQITGSLKYPHILLDSYPNLTQEQIMCLLLAGSPDSLSGVAPAALLQSMKYLVLDAEHTPSKLQTALRQLFAPFKHMYLIPSFSDQTSRGGLRGAIEIDIAERWRALIQKNFTLTEDTRLEIEYAITDDMWFRAFRDERHDVGAELEFRWKF